MRLREGYPMHEEKWHVFPWRVRYLECDRMGVVYHPQYLNWFEIGRTEWIRARGLTYRELEESGLYLPVIDANIHYKQPARYDDIVLIGTRVAEVNRLQIVFESEIRRKPENRDDIPFNEAELLASGNTRHVWLNAKWKPVRIDREYPELYKMLTE
jgi:acyl-CoA thioester hydrolase